MKKKMIVLFLSVTLIFGSLLLTSITVNSETSDNLQVIYFDVNSSNWTDFNTIYCHIRVVNGTGNWTEWQSKQEKCSYDSSTGIATYYLSKTGNSISKLDGKIYCVNFSSDTGEKTYDSVMSGSCLGDTLFCTGNMVENSFNADKAEYEALWRNNDDCGPLKIITSNGKIVGSTYPLGENGASLLAEFLIDYYDDTTRTSYTQSLLNELKVEPSDVMSCVAYKTGNNPTIMSAIAEILVSSEVPTQKEENYTWQIDENGTLFISGEGIINPDENSIEEEIPWYSKRESIKSVFIEEGITGIGNYSFMGCSNLVTVSIPESVTYIGDFVFMLDMDKLQSIDVADNNANYKSVDGVMFNKDMTEIEKYPNGRNGKYTIPETVVKINTCAFRECKRLTELEIPDSVKTIEMYAFYDCESLSSIRIPSTVFEIDSMCGLGYLFKYGPNMPSIDGFTIYGYSATAAETYANENGFTFIAITEKEIGDANGDGEVNAKDRMTLTRYLAKWSGYENIDMISADLNSDDEVNAKDRMILTRHLAKWQGYENLPFDKF